MQNDNEVYVNVQEGKLSRSATTQVSLDGNTDALKITELSQQTPAAGLCFPAGLLFILAELPALMLQRNNDTPKPLSV